MRILLDECVDRALIREIPGHELVSVHDRGWRGLRNGDVLRRAAAEFDVFLTVDRNLAFQQPIERLDIAVVILRPRTNNIRDLRPLVPRLLAALSTVKRGELVWIDR